MSSTDVIAEQTGQIRQPDQAIHFRHGVRRIMVLRILGGLLVLPFLAALVTRSTEVGGLVSLLLALAGGWLILHAQRTLAARPESVMVDSDGVTVLRTGAGPRLLRWADIAFMHHRQIRGTVSLGTRSNHDAMTLDADFADVRGFLEAVTRRIDASRRSAADAAPRPARTGAFERSLYIEAAAFAAAALGVVLGLLAHPAFLLLTMIALPLLSWHWLSAPQRVIVDDTAIWILRPLARDVIPLRAIREVRFSAAGRPAAAVMMIDHRDRGPVTVGGFDAAALPMFDAAVAAMRRAAAAARTGAAPARTATASGRGDSRKTALLHAGGAVLTLTGIAWITLLTGVPVRKAAQRGHTPLVRAAMLFPIPLSFADDDGLTALHHAVMRNDAPMTRLLIRRGADVHAQPGANANTPLHHAALHGQADVAALLIAAGTDVNARSAGGITPLAQAVLSTAPGDSAVTRLLLGAGALPDMPDDAGRTPFHHAAGTGDVAAIRLLARTRANIEAADAAGDRPIHHAARASRTDALSALLTAGANVNASGARGRTALAAAATTTDASPAVIDMLLADGARADVAGSDGWNAAQLAAQINNVPALELFARRRVRLDAADGTVPPALHIAVERGHINAVRALLRGGASPYRRWNGRSAMDRARAAGNGRMIALMQMR